MAYFIEESPRQLEVIGEYDVVVAGGGPGGVPAAIAASRNGAKTLIIERYGFFGGLATAGLMGPIFGYAETLKPYSLSPDRPKMKNNSGPLILGGIPVEIIEKLQDCGAAPKDEELKWEAIHFDTEMMKHVLDAMVMESGVDILFHTLVANVIMNGNNIEYLILENKTGRQAVKAKIFIDATGDGDIAHFAGAEYTKGRKADGATQPMGTKVIIDGVQIVGEEERIKGFNLVKNKIGEKTINIYHPFWGEISEQGITRRKDEVSPTATRVRGDGTNVRDLTRAEIQARKDILNAVDFYKKNVSGYENAYLRNTPVQIGVRETRQIIGIKTISGQDVLKGKKGLEDSVARGCFFLDIHCPLGFTSSETWICDKRCKVRPDCIMKRKYSNQLLESAILPKPIDYYDIPFGSLVPKSLNNLLISGRCISADHYAMSSVRVMATCFAIGEAAGTAAALCSKERVNPKNLSILSLRDQLRKQGVKL